MDRRSWTLVLILGAIWGASYLFTEIGLRDMGPAAVAWGRIALGAVVLAPVAWARGSLRIPGATAPLIVLLASFQVAIPFGLIARGQEEITSSLAGILVASTPLFTALLAIRLDQSERSEGTRMWGVVAGFFGVALLLGVDLSGNLAEALGGLAILLASLCYAIGGFVAKLRLPGAPGIGLAAWVMIASTVMGLPFVLADVPGEVPGAGPLLAVGALGVVGTGIAFAIFYELMTTVGPARTFIVTYLAPAFAVVYGALLLDEAIGLATVVGLLLIVGGSYLAAQGGQTPPARPSG